MAESKSKKYKDLPDWSKPEAAPKGRKTGVKGQTPAARAYHKGTNYSQGGSAPVQQSNPSTPSTSSQPSTTVQVSSGESTGIIDFTIVGAILLFIFAAWRSFIVPLGDLAWNQGSKTDVTKLPWKSVLAAAVFFGLLIGIAQINDDFAGLVMLFIVGIVLVALIMGGGTGSIVGFFNWLNPQPQSTTTGPTAHKPGSGPQPNG